MRRRGFIDYERVDKSRGSVVWKVRLNNKVVGSIKIVDGEERAREWLVKYSRP